MIAVGGACQATPPVPVRDYALTIDLRSDGTATVEERVTATNISPPAPPLRLPIPTFRIDGVTAYASFLDGVPLAYPAGAPPEPGGGAVVDAARLPGAHEITQAYEARGVLELQGARALFVWAAVPHSVEVTGTARVRIRLPSGSVPAGTPTVDRDGWQVEVGVGEVTFTGTGPAVADHPWLFVDLVLDDLSGIEPAWQAIARRARLLTPAFIAAGLFLVVVGVGVLIMMRLRYPPHPDPAIDGERAAVAWGLRRAGLAVMASAVVVGGLVPLVTPGLGWAPYAVPGGLAILGAMVYGRGATFPVPGVSGVLHSPRFRQQREP